MPIFRGKKSSPKERESAVCIPAVGEACPRYELRYRAMSLHCIDYIMFGLTTYEVDRSRYSRLMEIGIIKGRGKELYIGQDWFVDQLTAEPLKLAEVYNIEIEQCNVG